MPADTKIVPLRLNYRLNQAGIKSDPELESQISDRESFQTFLGLSSYQSSADHSTFQNSGND